MTTDRSGHRPVLVIILASYLMIVLDGMVRVL